MPPPPIPREILETPLPILRTDAGPEDPTFQTSRFRGSCPVSIHAFMTQSSVKKNSAASM